MKTHTLMIGESVPLGGAGRHLIEPADRVVLPFWPADPQLGPVAWPHGGVEVLMPGRWTPPIGAHVRYRRTTYLDQARALPGTVDTLVVAALRDRDGWVLPWTAGATGAVATNGVDRVAVVEITDRTVVPGAPRIRAGEIEVLGVAPPVAVHEARSGSRAGRASPEVERIGAAAAALVPPDSWVELGIGALPGAVLRHLSPDRVAGFLCGMVGEELLHAVHEWRSRGRVVPVLTAMVFAPEPLVARAVRDDQLRLVPVDVSHAPSPARPLVAVNAALTVDLTATVNTERSGGQVVSGRGGHPDFTRRAHLSPDGVSIVVLRSRDRHGNANIVTALPEAERSTDGGLVDVVVTEFGVADLRGLDCEHRGRAVISIAHPDDRSALASTRSVCSRSAHAASCRR